MHQHLQQLLFGYNFFSIFVKMMPMRPVHLSFIIALFVAISCQKQMVDSIIVQDTLPLIVETKTDLFYDSYSVSQEDIEKYVRFVNLAYGKEARSIVPVLKKVKQPSTLSTMSLGGILFVLTSEAMLSSESQQKENSQWILIM